MKTGAPVPRWSTQWARVQTLMQWLDRFEKQTQTRKHQQKQEPHQQQRKRHEHTGFNLLSTSTQPERRAVARPQPPTKVTAKTSATQNSSAVCSHGNGPSCPRCHYITTVLVPRTTAHALKHAKPRPPSARNPLSTPTQANTTNIDTTALKGQSEDEGGDHVSATKGIMEERLNTLRQFLFAVCGVEVGDMTLRVTGDNVDDLDDTSSDAVMLSTMHKAKGLEWR